ncbi:MAG: helix-turn-helix domain-containing protein [Acidobacteria bacterium]|nr:helix-turn-helix domain-containing protein [Acidobacteriota bacterium]
MNNDFTERLKKAFDNASMAEVARRIDVPHATVRNYYQGRMPAPEVLIKIANQTHVSLNWLLTGTGPVFIGDARPASFDRFLNDRIGEVVDRMLTERGVYSVEDLGSIDEPPLFDVTSAVLEFGDPHRVMSEWFRHEGREYPEDFGVAFFRGWDGFSPDEKVDAVRDAKKVIDRTLRKK